METVREREQELRRLVYQAGAESGLRALRELAEIEREKALVAWRRAGGDDLVKFQTQYNAMQTIVEFVTKMPQEFQKR
jgi:hypothetical protein